MFGVPDIFSNLVVFERVNHCNEARQRSGHVFVQYVSIWCQKSLQAKRMKHNIRYSVQCVTNPLQNWFAWHLGGAGTKTSSNLHPPLQLIQGRPGCLNLGRPRHIDIVNDAVSLSLSLSMSSFFVFVYFFACFFRCLKESKKVSK